MLVRATASGLVFREVGAAIAELGFCEPVLIGAGNTVMNGVIRVEAARQFSLDRIPCIPRRTSRAARLPRIALNRPGDNGAWSLEDLSRQRSDRLLLLVKVSARAPCCGLTRAFLETSTAISWPSVDAEISSVGTSLDARRELAETFPCKSSRLILCLQSVAKLAGKRAQESAR
jgi:hypothetical protein